MIPGHQMGLLWLCLWLFSCGALGCGGACGAARTALETAEAAQLAECLELPTADEAQACGDRVGAEFDKAFMALDGDASR